MERFNPFGVGSANNDDDDEDSELGLFGSAPSAATSRLVATSPAATTTTTPKTPTARYTTNFPDPFSGETFADISPGKTAHAQISSTTNLASSNRSNSVTFASQSTRSVDFDPLAINLPSKSGAARASGAAGATSLTSFLTRATSVTSSSVTDRVSGAVGSVRSAVDSISSQIQQATVPSNDKSPLDQQSAASYLASKLQGPFTSSVAMSSANQMPVISRQRVVLIVDSPSVVDWPQQFVNHRRMQTGLESSASPQSTLTSFISTATAQLTASSKTADTGDLIEQADLRDISVLANQSTSTVSVLVANAKTPSSKTAAGSTTAPSMKILRPEYVIIRQRTKDKLDHLRAIVGALEYCQVPMFEPAESWNIFQDKQALFARLLRVQKSLGRENFPLIPQIFCQTHLDLLHYINNSQQQQITMPCLVRIGPNGKGKIRIDNLQMLRDFASILATSRMSCTIEPYLDVKCDLVVQKLGPNLKLFRRCHSAGSGAPLSKENFGGSTPVIQDLYGSRESASRQTSIGSSVLSGLISSATQQQIGRRNSAATQNSFEKVGEVGKRYKQWIEAIAMEFSLSIEAFCLRIAVASNDREYIVGARDCSMDFVGSADNQEEDKRQFVELIVNDMNERLPQKSSLSRQTSKAGRQNSLGLDSYNLQLSLDAANSAPIDMQRKSSSQSQINGCPQVYPHSHTGSFKKKTASINENENKFHPSQGLGARSQSVSMQNNPSEQGSFAGSSFNQSSLADSSFLNEDDYGSRSTLSGFHQRQASLGQSFLDSTSTAFNSFQKQSMSFFKRFDTAQRSTGDIISSTPPMSAKSDKVFDRGFPLNSTQSVATQSTKSVGAPPGKNGFKSQSVDNPTDCSEFGSGAARKSRETPPKPPPPQGFALRQSSLASYRSNNQAATATTTTPHSTPIQTRQNSSALDNNSSASDPATTTTQRGRVIRQNSALSAFEPFDQSEGGGETRPRGSIDTRAFSEESQRHLTDTKRTSNFDGASINSADSSSTGTAEDTMKNLKQTFASIFGDR